MNRKQIVKLVIYMVLAFAFGALLSWQTGCASESREVAPSRDVPAPSARGRGSVALPQVRAQTDAGADMPDASEQDAQLELDAAEPSDASEQDARTGPLCSAPSPYASICEGSTCTEVCDWCGAFGCGVTCCDDPRYVGGTFWCVCP